MNTPQLAQQFFKHWVAVCKQRRDDLVGVFGKDEKAFTRRVLTYDNSVMEAVAQAMNLEYHYEYYKLDAISSRRTTGSSALLGIECLRIRRVFAS